MANFTACCSRRIHIRGCGRWTRGRCFLVSCRTKSTQPSCPFGESPVLGCVTWMPQRCLILIFPTSFLLTIMCQDHVAAASIKICCFSLNRMPCSVSAMVVWPAQVCRGFGEGRPSAADHPYHHMNERKRRRNPVNYADEPFEDGLRHAPKKKHAGGAKRGDPASRWSQGPMPAPILVITSTSWILSVLADPILVLLCLCIVLTSCAT